MDFSYSSLNSTQEPKELIEMGRRIQFSTMGDYVATDTTPLYDVNVFRNGKFEKVTLVCCQIYFALSNKISYVTMVRIS